MKDPQKTRKQLIEELQETRQQLATLAVSEVERKHAETELRASISHELRTALASIKGFATILLDYEDRLNRREKREYLETIDKNTDRLVKLIEQLLEMSRLEG